MTALKSELVKAALLFFLPAEGYKVWKQFLSVNWFCKEDLSRLHLCTASGERHDFRRLPFCPVLQQPEIQDAGVAHLTAAPLACSLTVPTRCVGTIGVLVTHVGLSAAALHPVLRCFPGQHCRPQGLEVSEPKQPHRTMSWIRLNSGRLFPLVEDDHTIFHSVSLSREIQGWNIFSAEGEFGRVQSIKDGRENLHEKLLFCGSLLNF